MCEKARGLIKQSALRFNACAPKLHAESSCWGLAVLVFHAACSTAALGRKARAGLEGARNGVGNIERAVGRVMGARSALGWQLLHPFAQQVCSCFLRKSWLFRREGEENRKKLERK